MLVTNLVRRNKLGIEVKGLTENSRKLAEPLATFISVDTSRAIVTMDELGQHTAVQEQVVHQFSEEYKDSTVIEEEKVLTFRTEVSCSCGRSISGKLCDCVKTSRRRLMYLKPRTFPLTDWMIRGQVKLARQHVERARDSARASCKRDFSCDDLAFAWKRLLSGVLEEEVEDENFKKLAKEQQEKDEVERQRHEQRLLAEESDCRGTSVANALSSSTVAVKEWEAFKVPSLFSAAE